MTHITCDIFVSLFVGWRHRTVARPDAAVDVAFFSPHKLLGGPGSVGLLVAKKRRGLQRRSVRRAKSNSIYVILYIYILSLYIYIHMYIYIYTYTDMYLKLFEIFVDSCRFHFVVSTSFLNLPAFGWGCCEMPCPQFLVVESSSLSILKVSSIAPPLHGEFWAKTMGILTGDRYWGCRATYANMETLSSSHVSLISEAIPTSRTVKIVKKLEHLTLWGASAQACDVYRDDLLHLESPWVAVCVVTRSCVPLAHLAAGESLRGCGSTVFSSTNHKATGVAGIGGMLFLRPSQHKVIGRNVKIVTVSVIQLRLWWQL